MSNAIFNLTAETRQDLGKGASRRLRREQDKVPAIIYGGNEKPTPIVLEHNKVLQAIEHEAFYSHILELNVDGKKQKVVLKDLQRHHFKRAVFHLDFQRVKASDVITMKVPVHFLNEDKCPGVKEGGIINHQLIDIEIRCKAADLKLDEAIHLSDLKLAKGIELVALLHDNDLSVVNVHASRQAKADDGEETAATSEESSDEKKS